jgi:hypothetical protein
MCADKVSVKSGILFDEYEISHRSYALPCVTDSVHIGRI